MLACGRRGDDDAARRDIADIDDVAVGYRIRSDTSNAAKIEDIGRVEIIRIREDVSEAAERDVSAAESRRAAFRPGPACGRFVPRLDDVAYDLRAGDDDVLRRFAE